VTAFDISCEASGAQVHDPGGSVIGACPIHGSILWKETIRDGTVMGQTKRELRAQEGQTLLVQLDCDGAVIRVYLAGTVEAPGCKPQAFREYVGYCSSKATQLEKRVDVKIDLAAESR